MAEPRSPLREFRHLDEKLHAVGLSAGERARWESLRALVAPEASGPAPAFGGGFDVEAAAQALRASLLPAGLRTAPPPEPPSAPRARREPRGGPPAVEEASPEVAFHTEAAGAERFADPPTDVSWEMGPVAPADPGFDPNAPPPEGAVWEAPAADPALAPDGTEAGSAGYGYEAQDLEAAYGPEATDDPGSAAPPAWEAAASLEEPGDVPAAWGAAPSEEAPIADGSWDPHSLAADSFQAFEAPNPAAAPGEVAQAPQGLDPSWAYGARAELFQATQTELASWETSAAEVGPGGEPQLEVPAADGTAGEAPGAGEVAPDLGGYMEFETSEAAGAGAPIPGEEAAVPEAGDMEVFQATQAELASWEAAALDAVAGEGAPGPGPEALGLGPEAGPPVPPGEDAYVEFETGATGPAAPEGRPGIPGFEGGGDDLSLEEFEPIPGAEGSEAAARLSAAAHAAPVELPPEPLPGAEMFGEEPGMAGDGAEGAPVPPPPPIAPETAPEGDPLFTEEQVESFAVMADELGGPGREASAEVSDTSGRGIELDPESAGGLSLASPSEFLNFVGDSPPGVVSLEHERTSREEGIEEIAAEDIEEIVEEVPGETAAVPALQSLAELPAPPLAEEPVAAEAPPGEAMAEPALAEDPSDEVISLEEIVITPPPPHAEALATLLPSPPAVEEQAPPAVEEAPAAVEAAPAAVEEAPAAVEAAPAAVEEAPLPESAFAPAPARVARAAPATPAETPPPAPAPEAAAPSAGPPRPSLRVAAPPGTARPAPAFRVPSHTPLLTSVREPEDLPLPVEPEEAPATSLVEGEHRVVVHTVEGQVLRGLVRDADLAAVALPLFEPSGETAEIASERMKAIFFMLDPGQATPPCLGTKVRVTFGDGRQVAGMSPDYSSSAPGFFVVPVDTRTNTARIWVYRAAVRQISVG